MDEPALTSEALPNGFFDVEGRIGRARYALISLVQFCIALVTFAAIQPQTLVGELLLGLLLTLPIVPTIIKRLHDINRSGTWLWGFLVPFLNVVLSIRLLLQPGTAGPNSYGSSTSSGQNDRVFALRERWWRSKRSTRGVVFFAAVWVAAFVIFVDEPFDEPKWLLGVPAGTLISYWLFRKLVLNENPTSATNIESTPNPATISSVMRESPVVTSSPGDRARAMDELINRMK